jgi:hypothetical protein
VRVIDVAAEVVERRSAGDKMPAGSSTRRASR